MHAALPPDRAVRLCLTGGLYLVFEAMPPVRNEAQPADGRNTFGKVEPVETYRTVRRQGRKS